MLSRDRSQRPSVYAGAMLAAGGAVLMVYGASRARAVPGGGDTDAAAAALGALCLVGNCLAMSLYFLVARGLSARYPPVCLTVRTLPLCLSVLSMTSLCRLKRWRT